MAQLASRSTVEEKLDSSMDSVNLRQSGEEVSREIRWEVQSNAQAHQSSQAKAVPQANAARRSSDPARVVRPVTSNAKATYMATCQAYHQHLKLGFLPFNQLTIDSLSISSRLLENLSSLRARIPTTAPMMQPRTIW